MNINTLSKGERLSNQRELDLLFDRTTPVESFIAYPLRVVFVEQRRVGVNALTIAPVAILASAPKKKFKHAVDRNRLKRLIRETYRLNKTALSEAVQKKDSRLLVGFLYVSDSLCTYSEMEIAMQKALNTLIKKITCGD
ncbi:MAG: ribonuclease P protein component [Candidatus Symbiothrix sp.]|jgi:ribonuclease P protein component|nr:ribonuclease P protein component [Candidatus Symbiothrix sp.]